MFSMLIVSLLLGQPTPASQPVPTAAEVAIAQVSTAELIKHLPPAGSEMKYRDNLAIEDPYSAEMGRRLEAGVITSYELGAAMKQCAVLRSTSKWFRKLPYAIWLELPHWAPSHSIEATVQNIEGLKIARAHTFRNELCGTGVAEQFAAQLYQVLGVLPEGTTSVVFQVAVKSNKVRRQGPKMVPLPHPQPDWNGEITLPVELIDATPQTADVSSVLTEAVKRANPIQMSGTLFENRAHARFFPEFRRPLSGPLSNASVSLQLELLQDQNVVYSRTHEDPDELPAEAIDMPAVFLQGEVAKALLDSTQASHFTFRVRGVKPKHANRWCRATYWSGEYTIPISELER